MSYKKYGLSAIDASGADHDKGIVEGPDGKYYQIDGFKHGQEDDLDKDVGKVFSSSLEADGRAAGFDPSTFNTAGDVQNALQALGGNVEEKEVEVSPRLATARARALQYEEDRVSGQAMKDLYDSENNPAEGFMERYKAKLGDQLKSGNYKDATTNSSVVASGANDVSIDVSQFARTNIDKRKDY